MTGFGVEPFELVLADPLVTADGTIDRRRGLIVRYGRGTGEATPLVPWTEPYAETERRLFDLAQGDPAPGRALARLEGAPAARHGVALALLDHHARSRGQPLYRLLGGRIDVEAVPVNATVDADTPAAVAAAGVRAADAGFPAVKLKVGRHDPEDDLERATALRTAVGDDVALRLDANGAWDAPVVRGLADDLAVIDLAYLEQPTTGLDAALIADLAGHDVPVAVDEAVLDAGLVAVSRTEAAAVVIKPMALGGPDVARAAAVTARSLGLTPVLSDLITGAIGRTAAAHVAASLGTPVPAGLATGERLEADLVDAPPPVESGRLVLPAGAGHGVEVIADD